MLTVRNCIPETHKKQVNQQTSFEINLRQKNPRHEAKYEDKFIPRHEPGMLPKTMNNITKENPKVKQKLYNLSKGTLKVFNCFLSFSNIYRFLHMSQFKIADRSDTSVRTVQRAIPKLVSLGYLDVESGKPTYRTNKYKVSSIFCDLDFRNSLKDILPALKQLPLALFLLYSSNMPISKAFVVPKCFSLYFNEDCSTKYYFEEQDSRSFTKNIHKGERLTLISTPSVCPNMIKNLITSLSSAFSSDLVCSRKSIEKKDVYYQPKPVKQSKTDQSKTDNSARVQPSLSSKTYAKEEFIANPFMDMLLSKNVISHKDLNKKIKG